MGQLLAGMLILAVAGCAQARAGINSDNLQLQSGFEVALVEPDGLLSWLNGSVGKTTAEVNDIYAHAYLEFSHRLADTLSSELTAEVTGDGTGDPLNVTEAYLYWKPVPRSNVRYRVKAGVFYPDISLENSRPGWRSPYTINYSTINTWVAEELRATGVELTANRTLHRLGPDHRLILQASLFGGNDPAGTILAWRGWAVHDRQSRFGDNLPLQPLPLNQPDEMFGAQSPFIEPFEELDDRIGYYAAAEWNVRRKLSIKGMYYDNRADPEVLKNGQYAWRTRFWNLGLKLALPERTTLVSQWMHGNTAMGPLIADNHAVDADFDSYYFMLSRKHDKHRLSARYERFRIDELDVVAEDNNNENGSAWTLSHRYNLSDRIEISTEWTRIESNRPAWEYNGFATKAAERQFQIRFHYQLR